MGRKEGEEKEEGEGEEQKRFKAIGCRVGTQIGSYGLRRSCRVSHGREEARIKGRAGARVDAKWEGADGLG
jgi:hypothetical protein